MTIMMGVVWFPGEYSGGRDGDQRSVVVQGSVGRDSGEARDRVDHWARDRRNAQRLQASRHALVHVVLLHLRPRQHRAHVSVLAHLVYQPLPAGNL